LASTLLATIMLLDRGLSFFDGGTPGFETGFVVTLFFGYSTGVFF